MKESNLLIVDAIINLVLGIPLLFFPTFVFETLGIEVAGELFLVSVLGGVLTGIGIALLIERYNDYWRIRGLGLGGAISINLFGAGALGFWLIKGDLGIPTDTYVILWGIVLLVFGISIFEIIHYLRVRNSG